ncbi:MAG: EamA family transporter [Sphingobium sp.]
MSPQVLVEQHRTMSAALWPLLVLLSVLLSSGSQVMMKLGMSSPTVQTAISRGGMTDILLSVALQPLVMAGIVCFGLSAGTWLMVLSRMNLSQAYPCVALGIVLTAASGYWLLGEAMPPQRLGGIALILMGVLLTGLG